MGLVAGGAPTFLTRRGHAKGLLENLDQNAANLCQGKLYRLEGDSNANTLVSIRTNIGLTPIIVIRLKAVCGHRYSA